MKVLQINAVNKIASTGRTSHEMNEFLNSSGHTCITAYSNGPQVSTDYEFKFGSKFDTKLHGLFSRISGKQGYFSIFATKKLLRFMEDFNPDAVILRNLHANYINLPMLLKFLANNDIPTVVVLHDCWFYTGKCCHYTVKGCFKWKESCGNCPQLKKYNKSWFFDRTEIMLKDKVELFNAIPRLAVIGVSEWIINEAKQSPVFKNARIFKKIYNWIDTDAFSPKNTEDLREKLNLTDKKVILCVASGWNIEKGFKTVLEISEKLIEDERIVLVGEMPGDAVLNANTVHIPRTDSVDELAKIYSMADVFVQPSLEETFGKVTAEALSCGTPIVCFDSTANPELVGDGCGSVVPVGDIDRFINEIRKVLRNGKAYYQDSCRTFAINSFSKKDNLYQDLSLLIELCR